MLYQYCSFRAVVYFVRCVDTALVATYRLVRPSHLTYFIRQRTSTAIHRIMGGQRLVHITVICAQAASHPSCQRLKAASYCHYIHRQDDLGSDTGELDEQVTLTGLFIFELCIVLGMFVIAACVMSNKRYSYIGPMCTEETIQTLHKYMYIGMSCRYVFAVIIPLLLIPSEP